VNHQQLLDNWARWDAAAQRDNTAALLAELSAARERIAELEAVLAYIDAHAPLADATCNEPGITLSEAARRAVKESQP
jgi:hypothetical protein